MKMPAAILAVAAIFSAAWPAASFAVAPSPSTTATAAASATYPAGTVYDGVTVSALRVGFGVTIRGDGSAEGQFDAALVGTSTTGQPQTVTITGTVVGGTSPSASSATFSGTCTVDMGDGRASATNVPFAVAVSTDASEKGTLTLTLGASKLSAATVTDGTLTIR